MPTYETVTLDRGPEPVLRTRLQVTDPNELVAYRLDQDDLLRVERFPLASVALKFVGDEDLDWVLRDVNDLGDIILDDRDLQIGDTIYIPRSWVQLAESSKRQAASARRRAITP